MTVYCFFLFFDSTSSEEIFPKLFYTILHPYVSFWNWLVPWSGKHLLALHAPIIGYSKGYNIFTGSAECIAGFLLFLKRTTLLGSIIALTIMSNVAAMNLSYDNT